MDMVADEETERISKIREDREEDLRQERELRRLIEDYRSPYERSFRSALLRAYTAEKLPELFETVRIKYKPCIGCGGDGVTKKTSIRSLDAKGDLERSEEAMIEWIPGARARVRRAVLEGADAREHRLLP